MPRAIKIMGIITVAFLGLFLMDSLGIWDFLASLSEPTIRDMLDDKYPDDEIDVEFLKNCTICDDSGCRTYPGPCYKVIIIQEGDEGLNVTEMLMDPVGEVLDSNTRPCTEWWCDAEPCRLAYTEQIDDTLYQYTNMDCDPPNITCDSEYEKCRTCLLGADCVSRMVALSPDETIHSFEISSTGEKSEISETELICRIYSRGNKIYEEAMGVEECGSMMYDYTSCQLGQCDYVPEFDLLPL